MTTDPFTTADDRWDESPHHLADHCEHAGVGKACRRCRRKFDASAQWARTYLAEQEPTDAEVEAVARMTVEESSGYPWETFSEESRVFHRKTARRRMSAARAVGRDAR